MLKSHLSCTVLIKAETIRPLENWQSEERAGVHDMEDEHSKLIWAHNKLVELGRPLHILYPVSYSQKLIPVN